MSHIFCPRYGSILCEDAQVIEATLTALCKRKRIKWLEIGMFRGGTGSGVRNFLHQRGVELEWWGIDAGLITDPVPPFPEARVIHGRSELVHSSIPYGFDGIFVDGCHCLDHVMSDTLHYAPKVRQGGFLLFHDCGKAAQGKDRQPHGPDKPEFYTSTVAALEAIKFPFPGWALFMEKEREGYPLGGTRSYARLR